jgi:hypothetical protein
MAEESKTIEAVIAKLTEFRMALEPNQRVALDKIILGVVPEVTGHAVSPDAVSPDAVSPDAVSPDAVSPDAVHPKGAVISFDEKTESYKLVDI